MKKERKEKGERKKGKEIKRNKEMIGEVMHVRKSIEAIIIRKCEKKIVFFNLCCASVIVYLMLECLKQFC